MKCKNCGFEFDEGIFCPKCGTQAEGEGNQGSGVNEPIAAKKKKHRHRKLLIVVVIVVILFIIIAAMGGGEDEATVDINQIIEDVQNGYLGNYDTVSIKDVLDYSYGEEEWKGGISNSGEYYIIEFVNDYVDIQFSVYEGEETFRLTGFAIPDVEESYEAYDIKLFMDALYSAYAGAYPESGLYIDESTDNDTLEGHYGPVKSVEEHMQQGTENNEAEEVETTEVDELEKESAEDIEYEQKLKYLLSFNGAEDIVSYWDEESVNTVYDIMYTFVEEQCGGSDNINVEEMRLYLYDSEYGFYSESEAVNFSDFEVIRAMATLEDDYWSLYESGDLEMENSGSDVPVLDADSFDNWYREATIGDYASFEVHVYTVYSDNENA